MGFFFTLLYIVSIHLGLPEMFPVLAPLRPQLIIAALAIVTSIPVLAQAKRPFPGPQLWLFSGFALLVILSWAWQGYWGGVRDTFSEYFPNAVIFFFAAINANTPRRLKTLALVLIGTGVMNLMLGIPQYHTVDTDDPDAEFFYVLLQRDSAESEEDDVAFIIKRLRAIGVLNDPNDFAQFLLVLMPLVFLWWKPGRRLASLLVVAPLLSLFVYGIFLTHSRGALVGIIVIGAVLTHGPMKYVGLAAMGIVGLAIQYGVDLTGGRTISVEAGSNRLSLWTDGIDMVRSSPLWGVGYRAFNDMTDGLTAHNSFLLCAAEIGLPAFFLFMSLLVVTILQLRSVAYPKDLSPDQDPDLRALSRALLISLYLFLATAFFLSRTYSPTLYLLLGMAGAIGSIEARRSGPVVIPTPGRWLRASAASAVVTLGTIYAMVLISQFR